MEEKSLVLDKPSKKRYW